jgi:hypothetical protein
MIYVCIDRGGTAAGRLVGAALARSVGAGQVALQTGEDGLPGDADIVVAVSPDEDSGEILARWCSQDGRKLVVFGRLPEALSKRVTKPNGACPLDPAWARSAPASARMSTESPARVQYTSRVEILSGWPEQRAFERFDFGDEWNNHGSGAIRADGSMWAIAENIRLAEPAELATIDGPGGTIASYAGLFDLGRSSVLWFNRPVGPIDSFEWYLVESFISSFRFELLACQPVLADIPFGHDAAVTMRLDCDEDIVSAEPLWQYYVNERIPFSLAITTSILPEGRHDSFIRAVSAAGGSILSHSVTHSPDWGGDYARAVDEVAKSADAIELLLGRRPENAVSPFHETPDFAIRALVDCGYRGCVGGTIHGYPETVTARGGALAGHAEGFVFHSQQCMLHGDCLADGEDPIGGYKTAFDLRRRSRSLFGYMDHPFSSRYQYGWASEVGRSSAHRALVGYIRSTARNTLFLSEDDALAFLRRKSAVRVRRDADAFRIDPPLSDASAIDLCVVYGGRLHRLSKGGLVLARRQ